MADNRKRYTKVTMNLPIGDGLILAHEREVASLTIDFGSRANPLRVTLDDRVLTVQLWGHQQPLLVVPVPDV